MYEVYVKLWQAFRQNTMTGLIKKSGVLEFELF